MKISRIYLRHVLLVLCTLALASSNSASGQQAAGKRPLTHGDYDSWRSIQGQRVSRDGKFLAYTLAPQDGDRELVVRNLATGSEWKTITGYVPPVTSDQTDEETTGDVPQPQGPGLTFSADGQSVVFLILPAKADVEKARKEKKKPEDMPKNALGIMAVASGEVTHIDRVKNFRVPDESSTFIVYQLETKPGSGPPPKGVEYGTDLVVRTLADKSERVIADVLSYSLSRDSKSLLYAVSSRTADSNGVYSVVPGTAAAPTTLLTGKGKYSRLTWDEKQTQAVFLSDRDDVASKAPKFKLYGWDRQSPAATELVSSASASFRQGWAISDRGQISFSLDGNKVFFGVAPAPDPLADAEAADIPAEEKVVVDLWHYKDDYVQPMQKMRAAQDRNKSYRAVFDRSQKKFLQLADESMDGLTPTVDGRWALGTDGRAYRAGGDYETRFTDIYLVNTADGSRKVLKQKQRGGLSWSPSGKYALYFEDKHWFTMSLPEGKITNLTKALGVAFWQEEDDHPSEPGSYGNMGWTNDDKYVLLYDHYDVWQVAADGSGAKNLTDGVGRKEKVVFRFVNLDEREPGEERGLDATKPILLHATNENTRDDGFYRDRIDGALPEKLIMAPKAFNNPIKAKDADVLVLSASTFNEFPDLLVTNSQFQNLKKVSNANPQKANINWATSELVRYKNTDGVSLSGILMKPENFDPAKKYPLMIYIYEKLSQNLHRFVNPSPGGSINASYYASNGYLVLMPDIVYVEGYPGQSALKCVLPAIQAVVDKGIVNENAIGIQGHSWGGYQIAYMVTQTNRFQAAAPGALVSNMTSAYSGIRWGTGQPRQVQYEQGQSRIGGSLWEYPMRYLENSPIFRVDRVQTPILMLHNDADTAVPWYQGIEYYLGLRRLGKEVYMFNYNGEPHGLRKRQNQKDYTMRLQQFFDHKLKGAPLPDWMEVGVPYLQKDKATIATKKKGQD